MQNTMSGSHQSTDDYPVPPVFSNLSNLLEDHPESFATGNVDIHIAALNATKHIFDLALSTEAKSRPYIVDLLSSLSPSEAPQTRSQTRASAKRKRNPLPVLEFKETPLSSLYVENADPEQIWAQLEIRAEGVCDMLQKALDGANTVLEEEDDDGNDSPNKRLRFSDLTAEDLEALGMDRETLEAFAKYADEQGISEDSDTTDLEEEDDSDDADLGEEVVELKDSEDSGPSRPSALKKSSRSYRTEVDDDFFDLDSFNAETEEAEAMSVSKGRLGNDLENDDSESDADSVDYFALADSIDDKNDLEESGSVYYRDFFDPPLGVSTEFLPIVKSPKVRFHEEVKVKNIKAKGKRLPVSTLFSFGEENDDDDDDDFEEDMMVDAEEKAGDDDDDSEEEGDDYSDSDLESLEVEGLEEDQEDETTLFNGFGGSGRDAIERLKDDLFDDGDEQGQDFTTHQKRMESLKEQIAALEAENIAPKSWTLLGEAHARGRPQNSLLEEDVEFERVMKSVPIVTEDVVQELEQRIKARIIDNNFDDVIRKRQLDDKPFLPSRIVQLQDTKSAQSLAEIYEGEYVAAQTGGVAGEDRDGKLKKEHDEIERLWESISNKLDALCNAHFTPKQSKATIINVSDIAAATLESALPTTQTAYSMLAPEEILAPSSSNGPQVRSELTPVEKRSLRNKERKMRKRTRDRLEKSVDKFSKLKGVKRQKDDALKKIVKQGKGVTVVGKKRKEVGTGSGSAKRAV